MRQVCEAVNEIHSLRIIHRDIKPENIVLHDVLLPPRRTSSSCATSAGQCTRTTS
jgi:serine/threonine protein kinase